MPRTRREERVHHKGSGADMVVTEMMPAESCSAMDDIVRRAGEMAAVAAENADAVDRDARFPEEAFAAAREQRLLGILVPTDLGGDGATVSDVVDLCYMLGRSCASTGMVFAM